jgi:hypothetical protein
MTNFFLKSIILSTAVLTIGFATEAQQANAKSCDLTVKGSGRHGCQCEILFHRKADWHTLMRLSAMNVCDSPPLGGGGAAPTLVPIIPLPVDDDCSSDFSDSIECPRGG